MSVASFHRPLIPRGTTSTSLLTPSAPFSYSAMQGGAGRGGGRKILRSPPPPPPPIGDPTRGHYRSAVVPGAVVDVVMKEDQRSGKTMHGTVARSLGTTPHHPRGIKVVLECGAVGRVLKVYE